MPEERNAAGKLLWASSCLRRCFPAPSALSHHVDGKGMDHEAIALGRGKRAYRSDADLSDMGGPLSSTFFRLFHCGQGHQLFWPRGEWMWFTRPSKRFAGNREHERIWPWIPPSRSASVSWVIRGSEVLVGVVFLFSAFLVEEGVELHLKDSIPTDACAS